MGYGLRAGEAMLSGVIAAIFMGAQLKFPDENNDFPLHMAVAPVIPLLARLSAAVFKADVRVTPLIDMITVGLCAVVYLLSAIWSYMLTDYAHKTKYKFWDYHMFCLGLKSVMVLLMLVDMLFTYLSVGQPKVEEQQE